MAFIEWRRLKQAGAAEALCNVHTEPAYIESNLDDLKIQNEILEMSCIYNINSATPLTLKERKSAAKDSMLRTIPVAELLTLWVLLVKRHTIGFLPKKNEDTESYKCEDL